MKEIIVDGVTYIPKEQDGDIKIVVADRGYVYVGNVVDDGQFTTITNAKNIRYWGTTKGLGELVGGPLSGTKLDMFGTVKIPNKAVIFYLDVEKSGWK
jgi:hypothetical protein